MSSSYGDLLSVFLSGGQFDTESETYSPHSGEIVGMLKQMKETMQKVPITAFTSSLPRMRLVLCGVSK